MPQSAFCIATSLEQTQEIMRCLLQVGVATKSISVLSLNDILVERAPVVVSKACKEGVNPRLVVGRLESNVKDWALSLVALGIPSLGSFLAVGPVTDFLVRMIPESGRGGLVVALIGIGIPYHGAEFYAKRILDGNILVAIAADNGPGLHKAWRILKHAGADDVADTHGRWSDDSTAELRPNSFRQVRARNDDSK